MMISRLSDIGIDQKAYFGAKAANLGFLISKGFNTPRGIALSLTSLDDLDMTGIIELLDQGKYYSVRSSALDEAGGSYGFSGQYETVLGVRKDHVEQAVRKVYKSRWPDSVSDHPDGKPPRRFGLIIQEMVKAEISGIIFTANPIDSDRRTLCIESAYGLGENLVSGLVNTDKYKIKKSDLEIDSVETTLKQRKLVVVGNRLVNRKIMDEEPSLKYEKVLEVAHLGIEIEEAFGMPQEIEFALEDEKIFILQSRPITSLWPSIDSVPDNHLLINLNAVQMMMEPFSPLGFRILKDMFGMEGASYLKQVKGYAYLDIQPLISSRYLKKHTEQALHFVDDEVQVLIRRLTLDSEMRKIDRRFMLRAFGFLFPKMVKAVWRMNHLNVDRISQFMDEYVDCIDQELKASIENAQTPEDKINCIQEILPQKMDELLRTLLPSIMAAIFLEKRIVKKWGQAVLVDIERGLENNLASQMGLMIERMTDYLIESEYQIESPDDVDELLESDPVFSELLHAFEDRFGFRGVGEIDIASPRYGEDRHLIFTILQNLSLSGETGRKKHLNRVYQKQAKEAEDAYGRIVKNYRVLMGMREHPNHAISRILMIVRQTYLMIGNDMRDQDIIDLPEDVFFLYPEEIKERDNDYRSLISSRRKRLKEYQRISPPKLMDGSGKCFRLRKRQEAGFITGTAASAGSVEAEVRVVKYIEDASDLTGKILVTRFTDPGWTPVFNQIAGLITEVGGLMTHGSAAARDYGIPAVVGVTDALAIFQDGDRIELDGALGIIKKK